MKEHKLAPLSEEFATADLGDARRTKRLLQVAEETSRFPGGSIPERAVDAASLEGTYRFLENEHITPESILEPHVVCTVVRAAEYPEVYVLHDTTEFSFSGTGHREGLGWLRGSKAGDQGFLSHYSIAVDPQGKPLGTVGMYSWIREGRRKGHRRQNDSQSDPDRESLRWQDQALSVGAALHGKTKVVHVMDREGDCYELLAILLEYDQRFIIRLSHDRRTTPGREPGEKLYDKLSGQPRQFEREVVLRENKKTETKKRVSVKERKKPSSWCSALRTACLTVRAMNQEIFVGNGSSLHLPPSLTLNFVEVIEEFPPEGIEPVLWRLVTTEPVETQEQIEKVIDCYRTRWLIEEFFKAIKTGCGYERHQLEDINSLLRMLAIETAIAWRMLLLRWLSRYEADGPVEHVLNPLQIRVLMAWMKARKRRIPPRLTIGFVLYEIAAMGGHIKHNGPPGWLVLRRGFNELLTMEYGWVMAMASLSNE